MLLSRKNQPWGWTKGDSLHKYTHNSKIKEVQYSPAIAAPVRSQEAKYVERWPNTTSAWAGWSRFDIPVDRYGGVHSLLICTSRPLGSSTCHQASQQENTYCTKYQKADRASTLCTLWCDPPEYCWWWRRVYADPMQDLYGAYSLAPNWFLSSYNHGGAM
jgi:hypothetical protein